MGGGQGSACDGTVCVGTLVACGLHVVWNAVGLWRFYLIIAIALPSPLIADLEVEQPLLLVILFPRAAREGREGKDGCQDCSWVHMDRGGHGSGRRLW